MSKPLVRHEPFLIKILTAIFIGVPLEISKSILIRVSKIHKAWIRKVILVIPVLLSLVCVLGIGIFYDLLIFYLGRIREEPGLQGVLKLLFSYGIYISVTLPLFLIRANLNEETRLWKSESIKTDIDPVMMRFYRLKSNHHKIYLGQSLNTRRPIFLTNDQRQLHCEIVGSTGTGKTESVLLPMLAHDIAHKKGAIILDGKGDLELYERICWIVKKSKRSEDFFFFSLAHPEKSNTYNPLYRGNPTELKDKLVNSMAWGDEFYRRMAEQAALTLFNAIVSQGKRPKFRELHSYLTDINALKKLSEGMKDPVLKEDIATMVNRFKDNPKFLSGLMADLFLTARSEFSDLLDSGRPQIDLVRTYEKQQICYFALDLQKFTDTSRRLGRMVIQDIRTVSSYIQANIRASKRHFFPVFIDDASSFLELNFIDFLNKCRASGFAVTMIHQSPGDLVFRGAPNFQQQVIENTNIKIILRQDDPYSVEKFTKIGGTRRTIISTYQTEDKMFGKGLTGTGSVREGQTFRVEPDLIRGLKRGEAVTIWKSPNYFTDHVKLDFFGHNSYAGDIEKDKPKEQDEAPKEKVEEDKQKNIQSDSKPEMEIENPLERITALEDSKRKAA